MTYTDSRQEELRARLETVRHNARLYGKVGHYDRAIKMFGALIEGNDPERVILPELKRVDDYGLAREMGILQISKGDAARLDRHVDRIWELAQDEAHYDRIMAGLVRLSQY